MRDHDSAPALKPMGFPHAALLFAVPSALIYFLVYVVMPWLNERGVNLLLNALLCIVGPLALMLVAAIVAYRMEGNSWNWPAFRERYRLRGLSGKLWLVTLGLFLFMMASDAVLMPTVQWLIQFDFFKPPDFLPPMVDPRVDSSGMKDLMGVPLAGSWWLIPMYIGILIFNILGEELWWRGYILPRQELVHGSSTWIVHGVLWDLFHFFWKWQLLSLLPTCLAISFVAQRWKNTTPGIVVHFVANGLALIPLTMGVAGMEL